MQITRSSIDTAKGPGRLVHRRRLHRLRRRAAVPGDLGRASYRRYGAWWPVLMGATVGVVDVAQAGLQDRPVVEAFLHSNNALRVARRGELVTSMDHPALLAWSGDGSWVRRRTSSRGPRARC